MNAAENLLNVNSWWELAGGLSASFQLINELGDALYRSAQVNDYINVLGKGIDLNKCLKKIDQ